MQQDQQAMLRPQATKRSFATLRTIYALVLREMATRYGRSPGGYIWAVFEPLGVIILLAVIFSLVLRNPSLGNNFVLFYATGYMVYNIYGAISMLTSRALLFSRPLLKYPSVTWVDAILARAILCVLTNIMVAYILLTGILIYYDLPMRVDIIPAVQAMGLSALVGLGVGSVNCVISGVLPAWDQVWKIISRPLFLASGVLYIYEDLPKVAQDILWFNPIVHLTGLMRSGFYDTYSPNYISLTYVALVGMILLAIGMLFLQRFHKDIINAG